MNLQLSIKSVLSIIDAEIIDPKDLFQGKTLHNLVIDSRSPLISAKTLFIILKGNKTSGEHYITDFINKGGLLILTEKKIDRTDIAQLIVKKPLRALQKLAAHHRRQFNIPVIGITGSNGKTTVKEWLYHVLKEDFNIVRSPKSYNSQIGVALSVLEMEAHHNLAIFEAGISQPNEMVHLEKMIQPTVGLFTGLGDAHNSGFGDENPEELKRKEKYILFKQVGSLIEWNENGVTIRQGSTSTHYSLNFDANEISISGLAKRLKTPFSNKAALANATLVYFTGQLIGSDADKLAQGILSLPSISMRLEKVRGKRGNILINDAYSLDEKSLEIGLQFLNANRENQSTALFIAEDKNQTTTESSLLNQLVVLKKQIKIDRVIYIGSKEIGSQFDFIAKQYETVANFIQAPLDFDHTTILFTGSRNCHLETAVNYYTEKKHITRLSVNLAAMRYNLNRYRGILDDTTRVLAMVKAQSYGGGILEVAKFLENEQVAYFGVAYADEGATLREGGITSPILVMNPEPIAFDDIIDHALEPSIYSLDLLNAFIHQLILRRKTNFPIHIKLDTGMNRLGFRPAELKELVEMLNAQPEVYVKSVFSHLSSADDKSAEGEAYNQEQIERYEDAVNKMEANLGYSFVKHLANSAGAVNYPRAHYDMVRLGIGLFGLLGGSILQGVENVLELRSEISQIRAIKAGESVGYGRKFVAKNDTQIGVIPVGYSDGLSRKLSNGKWSVQIREKSYPIIGNICMDMCMVDLKDSGIKVGEEVTLFGKHNTVFEMSDLLETIPYEVISGISSRVQRIYLDE